MKKLQNTIEFATRTLLGWLRMPVEQCWHGCARSLGGCGKEFAHPILSSSVAAPDQYRQLCVLCALKQAGQITKRAVHAKPDIHSPSLEENVHWGPEGCSHDRSGSNADPEEFWPEEVGSTIGPSSLARAARDIQSELCFLHGAAE
jgi:hypothetical protein